MENYCVSPKMCKTEENMSEIDLRELFRICVNFSELCEIYRIFTDLSNHLNESDERPM